VPEQGRWGNDLEGASDQSVESAAITRKRASPQARKRCPVRTILESRARTPSCASFRECPLSPTGSFRPDRVTIEWRQR